MEQMIVRKRKVVKLGKSLYSVLPHEFTHQHGLKGGDLISIIVNREIIKVVPFSSKGEEGRNYHG